MLDLQPAGIHRFISPSFQKTFLISFLKSVYTFHKKILLMSQEKSLEIFTLILMFWLWFYLTFNFPGQGYSSVAEHLLFTTSVIPGMFLASLVTPAHCPSIDFFVP